MGESVPKQASAYARITTDPTLDHGAVRLWFYLRNVRFNRTTQTAWPGQRRIAADISANIHSIKPWIEQLEAGGYLVKQSQGHEHSHVYSFPNLALRKEATRNASRVAPFDTSRCGKRQRRVCPKEATEPLSREPLSMKGVPLVAARARKAERWQLRKDADALGERIRQLSTPTPTDATQATLTKLKREKAALLKAYDDYDAPAVATPSPSKPERKPTAQPKRGAKRASIWIKTEAEREQMCRQLREAVTPSGRDNGQLA